MVQQQQFVGPQPVHQQQHQSQTKQNSVLKRLGLYERSLQQKATRQRKLESIRTELLQDCTFTPRTIRSSRGSFSNSPWSFTSTPSTESGQDDHRWLPFDLSPTSNSGENIRPDGFRSPRQHSNRRPLSSFKGQPYQPLSKVDTNRPTQRMTSRQWGHSNYHSPTDHSVASRASQTSARIESLYEKAVRKMRARPLTDTQEKEWRDRRLEEEELLQCTFRPSCYWGEQLRGNHHLPDPTKSVSALKRQRHNQQPRDSKCKSSKLVMVPATSVRQDTRSHGLQVTREVPGRDTVPTPTGAKPPVEILVQAKRKSIAVVRRPWESPIPANRNKNDKDPITTTPVAVIKSTGTRDAGCPTVDQASDGGKRIGHEKNDREDESGIESLPQPPFHQNEVSPLTTAESHPVLHGLSPANSHGPEDDIPVENDEVGTTSSSSSSSSSLATTATSSSIMTPQLPRVISFLPVDDDENVDNVDDQSHPSTRITMTTPTSVAPNASFETEYGSI